LLTFVKREFKTVFAFLSENRNEAAIIAAAALVLTLERYNDVLNKWFDSLLYFALIPVVIIILLRRNPLDFGLRLGNPKVWGFHVIIFCLIAWPVLHFSAANPSISDYYLEENFSLLNYSLVSLGSLFGSEFLYRGFLLFGLKEKFGEASILIQAIPFVLTHLGKPEPETLSTIITGIYFGYICYQGKSFWPALIVHLFINIYFVASVNL
jgi:membrane protease YdiL (CAAX protease family)